MAEVTINYKDAAIATMDASGTKTLQTQGKYCEDDIEVVYARPSGGGGSGPTFSEFTATASATNARDAALMLAPNPANDKVYFAFITKPQSTWVADQFIAMMFTGPDLFGGGIRWRNGAYGGVATLGNLYDSVIQPGDTYLVCEADFVL